MAEELRYEYGDKTILELRQLWEQGCLNLEPGFQRNSVWSESDRKKLVQSLLQWYPIPSIFLYKREEDNLPVYDVIDGKQRLETIFMFTKVSGFRNQSFWVRHRFPEDEVDYDYDWRDLNRWKKAAAFLGSKIQTVEVTGDVSDIINLFVRINSTGKALTSAEKRHAKFNKSPLLAQAMKLAKRFGKFLIGSHIVRPAQVARMKDVELMSELLASVIVEGPINKKAAVDQAVGNTSLNGHTLRKGVKAVITIVRLIRQMFPRLRTTRFHNISEFYTLFMVVWEMWHQGLVLTDRKRNATAEKVLVRMSNGVDQALHVQKSLRLGKKMPQLYSSYLLTVQQSTDALSQRKARADIVRGLLAGLFATKDTQRVFSMEQQ